MNTSETHLESRLGRSFHYGINGIKNLFLHRNWRIALYITVAGSVFFAVVDPPFLPIFLVMAAVIMVSEGTNSAIEMLCDFVHPDHHETIGKIKDMAAGNTVFAVGIASVVGLWEFVRLWAWWGVLIWAVAIVLIYIIFSRWG